MLGMHLDTRTAQTHVHFATVSRGVIMDHSAGQLAFESGDQKKKTTGNLGR